MRGEYFRTVGEAQRWLPFDASVGRQEAAHDADADRYAEWCEWYDANAIAEPRWPDHRP